MTDASCFADGYTDLPPGKLANVQTNLEMFERPALRAERTKPQWTLEGPVVPPVQRYRDLFRRVGGPYLWFSRLKLSDDELQGRLADPRDQVFIVRSGGEDAGLLELDFRTEGECELLYFGVISQLVGSGVGRWMMNRAIEIAWSRPIKRFWVHTCTMDHPNAIPFYIRSGFIPYKRMIEVFDDPRLTGLLPRDCAPDIPLIPAR